MDPSQHGAVGYLVQHTLEHIQHKKHPAAPEVKLRSAPEHSEVQYSVGLIMKHKRSVVLHLFGADLLPPETRLISLHPLIRSEYNCVIYGWDPKCTMNQEWITTMRVNLLPNGPNQPFYNVLVQDGTCRYAAQGTALESVSRKRWWQQRRGLAKNVEQQVRIF